MAYLRNMMVELLERMNGFKAGFDFYFDEDSEDDD